MSNGYQRNFADPEKRVAVLALDGSLIQSDRPTKSNFCQLGFLTAVDKETGEIDNARESARVEKRVLNQIREVRGRPISSQLRAVNR